MCRRDDGEGTRVKVNSCKGSGQGRTPLFGGDCHTKPIRDILENKSILSIARMKKIGGTIPVQHANLREKDFNYTKKLFPRQ